jgi:signal transduction histidine kinase
VQTKATAVGRLLARRDTPAAEKQLAPLEEAARGVFLVVREAVLGLKMASRPDARLATMLHDYARHFSQLSELPVQVDIGPGAATAALPAETEIQLLRIAQEALTNIRKHARARSARVCLSNGGPRLELRIEDDGCGFEPDRARGGGRPHFGLGTMRERAEAIGAEFWLESQPGRGTHVLVRLPLGPAVGGG